MTRALLTPLLLLAAATPALAQECTKTLEWKGSTPTSVALSPDGKTVATGGMNKLVRLWDAETAKPTRTLAGHGGPVRAVAFAGSQRLLTASGDGVVRVFDLRTGTAQALRGHQGEVLCLAVSTRRDLAATGGRDGTVRVWSLETGKCLTVLRASQAWAGSVAFDPAGKQLAVGADATVQIWNIAKGTVTRTLRHFQPISAVAWSPHDGHIIATGCRDGSVRLWNIAKDMSQARVLKERHQGAVRSLAFGPVGARIATGGVGGLVRVWNVADAELMVGLPNHEGAVTGLAFGREAKVLVSVSTNGLGRFWATDRKVAPPPMKLPFERLAWVTEPKLALEKARQDKRPLMVDFFAPW